MTVYTLSKISRLIKYSSNLARNNNIVAIIAYGSIARGDSTPGSTIDLCCLAKTGQTRIFPESDGEFMISYINCIDIGRITREEIRTWEAYVLLIGMRDGFVVFSRNRRLAAHLTDGLSKIRVSKAFIERHIHLARLYHHDGKKFIRSGEHVKACLAFLAALETIKLSIYLSKTPEAAGKKWELERLKEIDPVFARRYESAFGSEPGEAARNLSKYVVFLNEIRRDPLLKTEIAKRDFTLHEKAISDVRDMISWGQNDDASAILKECGFIFLPRYQLIDLIERREDLSELFISINGFRHARSRAMRLQKIVHDALRAKR